MNDLMALEHMADLRRAADSYRRNVGGARTRSGTAPRAAHGLRLALPHRHGTNAAGCEA
jgi:hypothetical protein